MTDDERRALTAGVASVPALVLVGVVVLGLEGGLLPGSCEGLACLAWTALFVYAGGLLLVWLVVVAVVALLRRRTPESHARVVVLRVLAGLSWLVVAGPIVLAVT